MKLLKAALKHKIFVSVALSETGAMRGLKIRTVNILATALVAVGLVVGSTTFTITNHLGETETVGSYVQTLAGLKGQSAQDEQLKILAQELGVLQSRLDRFDLIGQRLFNNADIAKTIGDDLIDGTAQGGADVDEHWHDHGEEDLSPDVVKDRLSNMLEQFERVDRMMDNGIALLAEKSAGQAGQPYMWPVISNRTRKTSNYGQRRDPFTGHIAYHSGVDIGGGWNVPIVSSGDGIVVFAGYRFRYGLMVEVRHANGFTTRYGHLAKIETENGQQVNAGDLLARMGSTGRSTGPHLHFEVLIDDQKVNPYPFIKDDLKLARKRVLDEDMKLALLR